MRTPSKIITALALAGLAVAGGAAFTGAGVTNSVSAASQYIGGTVDQNVSGAELSSAVYGYWTDPANASHRVVNKITLTFVNPIPDPRIPSVVAATAQTNEGTFPVGTPDGARKVWEFAYLEDSSDSSHSFVNGFVDLSKITVSVTSGQ